MLIPIGTDRPLRRPTLINFVLVALNIGVFLASAALEKPAPEAREWLYSHGWLDPRGLHWWSFVTYSFLHTGAMHLLANMLVLWVFGGNVEDRLGRVGYTALYLSGAVVAGGAHVLFDTHPVIGASGAVAAVTGAYLVLFPRTVVRCLLLFFMVGIITLPAWAFIMLAIAKDFVYLANSSQAMIDGARVQDSVARAAHLGGYSLGGVVSLALLWTRVLPREPFDLFSIARQAKRRRALKEAALSRERENHKRAEARKDPVVEARLESLATRRSEVSTLVSRGELSKAATAYESLSREFGDLRGAMTLSRHHQHDMANYLFAQGQHTEALGAYERLAEAYPKDAHAPSVRLMVALIAADYLNDPVRAKQALVGLEPQLTEDHERELARRLLADLA